VVSSTLAPTHRLLTAPFNVALIAPERPARELHAPHVERLALDVDRTL
jgi:hypothetical protein